MCDQQTEVWGRTGPSGELGKIGNSIDSYCAAYLEGTFEAMLRAKEVCPEQGNWPDEHLLLSVVRTYAETAPAQNRARQEFVAAAFANAYSCAR